MPEPRLAHETQFIRPVEPTPSPAKLIGRARDLVPLLRDRVAATEQARCLLSETVIDFTKAGRWRILQSPANGGFGFDIATHVEIVKEIASGCASSAWVLSLFSQQHFLAGAFGEVARREIFGSEKQLLLAFVMGPAGRAEVAPGGYRLSGRWPYVSGIDICTWAALTSFDPAPVEGERRPLTFLVPRQTCSVVDDWHVLGLRGTGSKCVELDAALVPAQLTYSYSSLVRNAEIPEGPTLEGVPIISLFAICIAALAPGIARAAIEAFHDRMKNRRNAFMSSPQSADAISQMRLAEAVTRVEQADLILMTAARDLSRRVAAREAIDAARRTRYRLEMAEVLRICNEVVLTLFTTAGTGAAMDQSPLQRHLRDMLTLRSHVAVNLDNAAENHGRVLLDLAPKPPFI